MKEQPKMGLAYKYNSNAISDYLYEWEVTGLTAQT